MPTSRQESAFSDEIISHAKVDFPPSILDSAVTWISDHLDPSEVFDRYQLESWATSNGFVAKENGE